MTDPSPSTIVFGLRGSISDEDVRWMCERVRHSLQGGGVDDLVCDVGGVTDPDAATVEALARMQLTARRLGRRMKLRRACGELRELLMLSGLTDVLPCDELPLEASGQAEQREPPGRVEEERDPADPVP